LVVEVGAAITKLFPGPISVPPQLPVYHLSVAPEPSETERVIVPPSSGHKLFRSELAVVDLVGEAVTVTVADVEK
jgi:hypothetical protein